MAILVDTALVAAGAQAATQALAMVVGSLSLMRVSDMAQACQHRVESSANDEALRPGV